MNQSEQESLGSIQTRVHHLEQGLTTLSRDVRDGFARITEQFQTQATRFEQERKPQWQAYGVMLSGMVILGTLAYWPIREQQARLETLIAKVDDGSVRRAEFDLTQDRGRETRTQLAADIARTGVELQRQIDDLKKSQSDTYSLRDVVIELKQNQKELLERIYGQRPSP